MSEADATQPTTNNNTLHPQHAQEERSSTHPTIDPTNPPSLGRRRSDGEASLGASKPPVVPIVGGGAVSDGGVDTPRRSVRRSSLGNTPSPMLIRPTSALPPTSGAAVLVASPPDVVAFAEDLIHTDAHVLRSPPPPSVAAPPPPPPPPQPQQQPIPSTAPTMMMMTPHTTSACTPPTHHADPGASASYTCRICGAVFLLSAETSQRRWQLQQHTNSAHHQTCVLERAIATPHRVQSSGAPQNLPVLLYGVAPPPHEMDKMKKMNPSSQRASARKVSMRRRRHQRRSIPRNNHHDHHHHHDRRETSYSSTSSSSSGRSSSCSSTTSTSTSRSSSRTPLHKNNNKKKNSVDEDVVLVDASVAAPATPTIRQPSFSSTPTSTRRSPRQSTAAIICGISDLSRRVEHQLRRRYMQRWFSHFVEKLMCGPPPVKMNHATTTTTNNNNNIKNAEEMHQPSSSPSPRASASRGDDVAPHRSRSTTLAGCPNTTEEVQAMRELMFSERRVKTNEVAHKPVAGEREVMWCISTDARTSTDYECDCGNEHVAVTEEDWKRKPCRHCAQRRRGSHHHHHHHDHGRHRDGGDAHKRRKLVDFGKDADVMEVVGRLSPETRQRVQRAMRSSASTFSSSASSSSSSPTHKKKNTSGVDDVGVGVLARTNAFNVPVEVFPRTAEALERMKHPSSCTSMMMMNGVPPRSPSPGVLMGHPDYADVYGATEAGVAETEDQHKEVNNHEDDDDQQQQPHHHDARHPYDVLAAAPRVGPSHARRAVRVRGSEATPYEELLRRAMTYADDEKTMDDASQPCQPTSSALVKEVADVGASLPSHHDALRGGGTTGEDSSKCAAAAISSSPNECGAVDGGATKEGGGSLAQPADVVASSPLPPLPLPHDGSSPTRPPRQRSHRRRGNHDDDDDVGDGVEMDELLARPSPRTASRTPRHHPSRFASALYDDDDGVGDDDTSSPRFRPGEYYCYDQGRYYRVRDPTSAVFDVRDGRDGFSRTPIYIVEGGRPRPRTPLSEEINRRRGGGADGGGGRIFARDPLGCSRLNPYCSICRARYNLVFVDGRMRPLRFSSPRAVGDHLGDCRMHDGLLFGGPTVSGYVGAFVPRTSARMKDEGQHTLRGDVDGVCYPPVRHAHRHSSRRRSASLQQQQQQHHHSHHHRDGRSPSARHHDSGRTERAENGGEDEAWLARRHSRRHATEEREREGVAAGDVLVRSSPRKSSVTPRGATEMSGDAHLHWQNHGDVRHLHQLPEQSSGREWLGYLRSMRRSVGEVHAGSR